MIQFTKTANVIEDQYGKLWEEDGIMIATYKEGTVITEEIARSRTRYRKMLSGGKKVPALAYSKNTKYWTRASKKYANSREGLQDMYAVAIVNTNPVMNIIIEASFVVFPPIVPIKMFQSDKKAKEWLFQMKEMRESMLTLRNNN